MEVLALVGSSGTGKSHQAMKLARQQEIAYVIDDGLLIHNHKKLAGSSAKREASKIAAVKRAIFFYEPHRKEVAEEIKRHNPSRILLIGTSDEMVAKIAEALELPTISHIFYIEDISTPEEIKTAQEMRVKHGKHVIPIPSVELKRDFSGYFMDSFKVWTHRKGKSDLVTEKSVVRPTFSYLGHFTVSNKALVQIVQYALTEIADVKRLVRVKLSKETGGIRLELDVVVMQGDVLIRVAERCQKHVKERLESMTQLNVLSIDLNVKDIYRSKSKA